MRFGFVEGFFNRSASNETDPVNMAMDSMRSMLERAGAIVVSISDPFFNSSAISARLDTQRYEYRQEMDTYLQRSSLKGRHPSSLTKLYRNSNKFLVIPSQHEYVNTALVSSTDNTTSGTHLSYDTVRAEIQNLKFALQETFARNRLDAMLYPEQQNLVVKIGSPSQSGRNGILAALTGSPVITVRANQRAMFLSFFWRVLTISFRIGARGLQHRNIRCSGRRPDWYGDSRATMD